MKIKKDIQLNKKLNDFADGIALPPDDELLFAAKQEMRQKTEPKNKKRKFWRVFAAVSGAAAACACVTLLCFMFAVGGIKANSPAPGGEENTSLPSYTMQQAESSSIDEKQVKDLGVIAASFYTPQAQKFTLYVSKENKSPLMVKAEYEFVKGGNAIKVTVFAELAGLVLQDNYDYLNLPTYPLNGQTIKKKVENLKVKALVEKKNLRYFILIEGQPANEDTILSLFL